MTDPLACLRGTAIVVGVWNIIYALIQIGVIGWQVKVVKDRQSEWENREVDDGAYVYQNFKARFPGLYGIYTETPERRRINAMYAIVLICIVFAIAHLPLSILMLYGAIKKRKNLIWPWFCTAAPLIIMSTTYAVMWWSGDVFTEQLVMSVAEFVMSIAISGPAFCAVVFYYIRLTGDLKSIKPGGSRRRGPRTESSEGADVPPWRTDWPERPPRELEKRLRRKSRERREKEEKRVAKEQERLNRDRRRLDRERREAEERGQHYAPMHGQPPVDYYVPGPGESSFPWNTPIARPPPPQPLPMGPPRKKTTAEVIENLYYEHYPEDMPKEVGKLRRERP